VVTRIKKDGVKAYVRLATNTLQHLQLFIPCGGDKHTILLAVLLEFHVLVCGVKTLGLTFDVYGFFFSQPEISKISLKTGIIVPLAPGLPQRY
jgi:hypothetical protein